MDETTESISDVLFSNPFSQEVNYRTSGKFEYSLWTPEGQEIISGKAVDNLSIGASLQSGLYILKIKKESADIIYKIFKR